MRTTCNCPTTKLATFLFKEKRLSQASLELSSSRGLFGSLENERKRREKREKQTLTKAAKIFTQNEKLCQKEFLGLQIGGGGGGGALYRPPNVRKYKKA